MADLKLYLVNLQLFMKGLLPLALYQNHTFKQNSVTQQAQQ